MDKLQFQLRQLIGQAVGIEARKEAVPKLLYLWEKADDEEEKEGEKEDEGDAESKAATESDGWEVASSAPEAAPTPQPDKPKSPPVTAPARMQHREHSGPHYGKGPPVHRATYYRNQDPSGQNRGLFYQMGSPRGLIANRLSMMTAPPMTTHFTERPNMNFFNLLTGSPCGREREAHSRNPSSRLKKCTLVVVPIASNGNCSSELRLRTQV